MDLTSRTIFYLLACGAAAFALVLSLTSLMTAEGWLSQLAFYASAALLGLPLLVVTGAAIGTWRRAAFLLLAIPLAFYVSTALSIKIAEALLGNGSALPNFARLTDWIWLEGAAGGATGAVLCASALYALRLVRPYRQSFARRLL